MSLQDEVMVTITGSPLASNPIVSQPVICKGVTDTTFTMAGGGSGNYTYAGVPFRPDFTSTEAPIP